MLTLPTIVKRKAQHYVAIRQETKIPFQTAISKTLPKVEKWLSKRGVTHGPMMIKYDFIKMPELTLQIGFLRDEAVEGDDLVTCGILPAGPYATLTNWGHYRNLRGVTAMLMGWANDRGLKWDSSPAPGGENFVSRFELYPNGPQDEPDADKWETQIWIRTRA